MYQATLVLEGGATRGVYTAGILDYFMEQELEVSNILGVSAGSCNCVDYISGQIGRSKDCMIITKKENVYYGIRKLVEKGKLIDMDLLFDDFANKVFPFDYDAFLDSDTECEIVATNCVSGKAEYMKPHKKEELMSICRASSSVPLIAPMVWINDIPYLDGGIADSVPIDRAMELGNKKIIVILTRNKGYRKKAPSKTMLRLCKRKYSAYPKFISALENRYKVYNKTMDFIDELEKKGDIFVMRPTLPPVSRFEKSVEKLNDFYNHGYEDGKKNYTALLEYIK